MKLELVTGNNSVTRKLDGYRYVNIDFDVMTHHGEHFYTTISTQLRLYPFVVGGRVFWGYQQEEAEKSVFSQLPSLRNRKDVQIIACEA